MKLIKSTDIPGLIKDGDMVVMPGITSCYAEEAMIRIAESYEKTGHPAHLTLFWQAAIGILGGDRGISSLCQDGLFDIAISGHISGCGVPMTEFCRDNRAEFYNFPQGVTIQLLRAAADGGPGVITKIGLGTYMDPRVDCAQMNSISKKRLVELLEIDGEEWLLYKTPKKKFDVVLIRGTYIDEEGNISIENEAYKNGYLMAAAAAKATGGIVIAQVEKVIQSGSRNPKDIEIPGILVDYAFEADPYYHMQTGDTQFDPAFAGQVRVPITSIPPMPMNFKKVICRRAAMEINKGDIVNLGVGTPEFVSNVAGEEGCPDLFTLTSESGAIGGLSGKAHDFGASRNASAMIENEDMMVIYNGGTLDEGILGFLQVDENGNVNSSSRNGLGIGIGGFMNVAAGASHPLFIAQMVAGTRGNAPVYEFGNGQLKIVKEGNVKKFIKKVDQISFNGKIGLEQGKDITFITERAVFKLTKEGMTLIEIAPGLDLQKDVLDQMEFEPIVSPDLKLMPAEIFNEEWGGLAEHVHSKG